jgi:hypothetical protein
MDVKVTMCGVLMCIDFAEDKVKGRAFVNGYCTYLTCCIKDHSLAAYLLGNATVIIGFRIWQLDSRDHLGGRCLLKKEIHRGRYYGHVLYIANIYFPLSVI